MKNDTLGERFWTTPRRELREWFTRNAQSLGELYEGALIILYGPNPVIPGWTRFVAHAVREIRNRLPVVVGGWESPEALQYKNRLDVIQTDWEAVGLPVDGTVPATLEDASIPEMPQVRIPRQTYVLVATLVRDHTAARQRPAEAAARFFETVAVGGEGGDPGTLRLIAGEWVQATSWFHRWMHDGGKVDAACDRGEFVSRFEQFERILMGVIRDFFKTTDALDQVLDEANR